MEYPSIDSFTYRSLQQLACTWRDSNSNVKIDLRSSKTILYKKLRENEILTKLKTPVTNPNTTSGTASDIVSGTSIDTVINTASGTVSAVITIDKWQLLNKIGKGKFGTVYLGKQKGTSGFICIKIQSIKSQMVSRELEILKKLNNVKGFPTLIHKTLIPYHDPVTNKESAAIIMQLLGPSIHNRLSICGTTFSLKTTLMIAIQMIERLEALHAVGIIHRDIKPSNIVLGPDNKMIYLIDFGVSTNYRNRYGYHMPYRTDVAFVGNNAYSSINTHCRIEQSRRDDLEALGYMLIYFLKDLPWHKIKRGELNRIEYTKKIGEEKKLYDIETLCKDIPAEFAEYMKIVCNLSYEDDPPYSHLINLFNRCCKRESITLDYMYDWIKK